MYLLGQRVYIAVPVAAGHPHPLRHSTHVCSSSLSQNGGTVTKKRGPIVADLRLDQIRRPLFRTRTNDPEKVQALMDSIAEIGLQEPIEILEVDGIYYGFSGCHRFEAHQKLGLPTIRCRIRRGTKETLRHHMR